MPAANKEKAWGLKQKLNKHVFKEVKQLILLKLLQFLKEIAIILSMISKKKKINL